MYTCASMTKCESYTTDDDSNYRWWQSCCCRQI